MSRPHTSDAGSAACLLFCAVSVFGAFINRTFYHTTRVLYNPRIPVDYTIVAPASLHLHRVSDVLPMHDDWQPGCGNSSRRWRQSLWMTSNTCTRLNGTGYGWPCTGASWTVSAITAAVRDGTRAKQLYADEYQRCNTSTKSIPKRSTVLEYNNNNNNNLWWNERDQVQYKKLLGREKMWTA